jgi:hypothetical protein
MASLEYLKGALTFFSIYDFFLVLATTDNILEEVTHNDAT